MHKKSHLYSLIGLCVLGVIILFALPVLHNPKDSLSWPLAERMRVTCKGATFSIVGTTLNIERDHPPRSEYHSCTASQRTHYSGGDIHDATAESHTIICDEGTLQYIPNTGTATTGIVIIGSVHSLPNVWPVRLLDCVSGEKLQ